MTTENNIEEAIEILQQLGLKEYEARCFVGLTRLSTATAKQLSEITDVPRTRIYDAIRVLEAQGLVEVQHSNPRQFRAVPLREATETLRDQYEDRIERLQGAIDEVERVEFDQDSTVQEVWSLSGTDAIANRTFDLLSEATSEVVLVVGDESLLSEELITRLNGISSQVNLIIGAVTTDLQTKIHEQVPSATTFTSDLAWIRGSDRSEDEPAIGRLLLTDRSSILVSSIVPTTGAEHAIYGGGFGNGLVVISRRLMAEGLLPLEDPGQ